MRKLLNTIHILARIFLYLSVIGVLLLYFFKPGILEAVQKIVPTANTGAWLAEVTALSIAAVLFAVAELAYKSLLDNEYRVLLSSSVLKPAFDRYDLSDKRFTKTAKGEFDFNASLRDVTDVKERVMQELAWERQNCRKLQKKTIGNKVFALLFFVAGLVFVIYPIVHYLITRTLLTLAVGTVLDYGSLVALILTIAIVFEIGNNQGQIRRLNTILSIRGRSDELSEKPPVLPAVQPEPAVYSAPAPYVYEAPKPAAPSVPVAEPAPAAPAMPVVPAEPVKPEEPWKPEPVWSGVPEEPKIEEKPQESPFVNLTPEEETPDE